MSTTLKEDKIWYIAEYAKIYSNRQTLPIGMAVFTTKWKAVKCYNDRIREYEANGWKAKKHWSDRRAVSLNKDGLNYYKYMYWGEKEIDNTEYLTIIG